MVPIHSYLAKQSTGTRVTGTQLVLPMNPENIQHPTSNTQQPILNLELGEWKWGRWEMALCLPQRKDRSAAQRGAATSARAHPRRATDDQHETAAPQRRRVQRDPSSFMLLSLGMHRLAIFALKRDSIDSHLNWNIFLPCLRVNKLSLGISSFLLPGDALCGHVFFHIFSADLLN